jgi:hypothetical protein
MNEAAVACAIPEQRPVPAGTIGYTGMGTGRGLDTRGFTCADQESIRRRGYFGAKRAFPPDKSQNFRFRLSSTRKTPNISTQHPVFEGEGPHVGCGTGVE